MQIAVWLNHPEVACWEFSPANLRTLQSLLPQAEISVCGEAETFKKALETAEIALVWTFKQEWFALAPRLRLLATPAAGKDYFTVAPPPQVELSYGSFHGEIIAETVIGYILACCRGILASERLKQNNPWPRKELGAEMRTLRGATVTILGFGAIGTWIGQYAKAFGARVIGVKRAESVVPKYYGLDDKVVGLDKLDGILPETDHLVLALPGGEATENILDRRRLELLPRKAYIYNIGRGNAVDEAALAEALRAERLAGACLDVFRREPLAADSPLRGCGNALLMPHASAIAPQYLDLFCREVAARNL